MGIDAALNGTRSTTGFSRLAGSGRGVLLLGGIFGALAVAGGVRERLTTGPGHFICGRNNWRDNTSLRVVNLGAAQGWRKMLRLVLMTD
jgi:hypothetical protein